MTLMEEKTLADHDINVRSIRQELQLLGEQLKKHGRNEPSQSPAVQSDPDTVSRQAVLNAVDALTKWTLLDRFDRHVGVGVKYYEVKEAVKDLPPSPSRLIGHWMRMSDLNESEDDRYKCSCCGNVVHHRDKVFLYTYNSWCGACGANMNAKDYAAYMQGGAS